MRAEVLAAAADLLFTSGLVAVTFDRVAAASGASRTTIYKWWPTPGALAAESYLSSVEHALGFSDTGDIRADLRAHLRAFANLMLNTPAGRVIREMIGAAQIDIALRDALTTLYSHPRRDDAIRALARAQGRGQLRHDAPLDVLVDQLWGACYHRMLLLNEPVDETLIDRMIDNALYGCADRPHNR